MGGKKHEMLLKEPRKPYNHGCPPGSEASWCLIPLMPGCWFIRVAATCSRKSWLYFCCGYVTSKSGWSCLQVQRPPVTEQASRPPCTCRGSHAGLVGKANVPGAAWLHLQQEPSALLCPPFSARHTCHLNVVSHPFIPCCTCAGSFFSREGTENKCPVKIQHETNRFQITHGLNCFCSCLSRILPH